jgi:hypothetical protein
MAPTTTVVAAEEQQRFAKVEEKRKEDAEAKEKAEAQKKLVDNGREELEKKGKGKKVQVINVHELEKTIPPMHLKYLPDDYTKLDNADKYRELSSSYQKKRNDISCGDGEGE